jgi:vesicle coat complex subunit
LVSLIASIASIVLLVICLILIAQVRTLKSQMDAFASEWRQEMIDLIKYATTLAHDATTTASETKELLEEHTSDVQAIDRMTKTVVQTIGYPFVSAGRFRLAVRRGRKVFKDRREGLS